MALTTEELKQSLELYIMALSSVLTENMRQHVALTLHQLADQPDLNANVGTYCTNLADLVALSKLPTH